MIHRVTVLGTNTAADAATDAYDILHYAGRAGLGRPAVVNFTGQGTPLRWGERGVWGVKRSVRDTPT
jgi:hypothetical protein